MLDRADRGTLPVTEAEFAELAAWFAAHEAGLAAVAGPTELLALGGGRRTWCSSVRFGVRAGLQADGAGQLAEDIRQLRARYGERAAAFTAHQGGST